MKLITLVLGMVVIAVVGVAAAQAPAQKPTFEVASIEPINANSVRSGGSCHGKDSKFSSEQPHLTPTPPLGRCVFKGVTLHALVRSAYAAELQDGIDDFITNEPSWMKTELFNVDAAAASPETTTQSELYVMLQTLLADRFKLRLHRDHKEVQGYALVVAKNGPKLKSNTSGDEHGSLLNSGPFELEGTNVALSGLASSLSGVLRAPVVDKTGLGGRYDFTLRYAPINAFFEALQDQLGLRLQEEKESVVVLVIDSVQRPRDN
jgi:uncharacterized protein (TIGR03435 family)